MRWIPHSTRVTNNTTKVLRTGSDGAGILANAGIGGVPPLKAFDDVRAFATDRRRMGARDRDAMVDTTIFVTRDVQCVAVGLFLAARRPRDETTCGRILRTTYMLRWSQYKPPSTPRSTKLT